MYRFACFLLSIHRKTGRNLGSRCRHPPLPDGRHYRGRTRGSGDRSLWAASVAKSGTAASRRHCPAPASVNAADQVDLRGPIVHGATVESDGNQAAKQGGADGDDAVRLSASNSDRTPQLLGALPSGRRQGGRVATTMPPPLIAMLRATTSGVGGSGCFEQDQAIGAAQSATKKTDKMRYGARESPQAGTGTCV